MAGWMKRRSARIALGVVALLVLVVVLAPLLVPAGRVRDLVVARVRTATGAEVSFGAASVRLVPRLSVAVADGRISGSGEALRRATGQPNPLVRYEVGLDRLEVSLALGPLLRKRIEIGRVRLVRPRVDLVTMPPAPAASDGAVAPATGTGAGPAPFALAVAALEARDGALTWHEEGSGRAVKVQGWQQTLTAGDLTALATRLQALSGSGAVGVPGTVSASAASPASAAGRDVRLGLSSQIGELTLEGFGKVSPLRLRDLTVEAEATVPPAGDALRVKLTRAAWGRLELSGEASLTGDAASPRRLAGTWQLRETELPPLVADLLPLLSPVPGPAGAWLGANPVAAGRLTASGGIDLPWPLPNPVPPDVIVRALTAEGRVSGGSVKLPDGKTAIAVETAFGVRDGALVLSGLQARDAAGSVQLGGGASLPLPPAGGRVRADLKGSLDLAAAAPLLALLPESPPAPGRPAAVSWKVFRTTGKVELTATADVPDAPPLDQPLAWRQRLQGSGLAGVRLAATATGFTVEGPGLAPALAVRSVSVTSDLRTATVRLEGAEHPVFAGGGEVKLTRLLPDPHAEVDLRLTRFDADKLTEMVNATAGAPARAARAESGTPGGGLSPLLSWAVATALAAAPAAAPAVPPGEALPPRLTASYRAATEAMTLGKLAYTQVTLDGTLANRVFTVPRATAHLGGGTLAGSGKVDYAADPWGRLDFQAKMQEVPAATLLAPYAKGAASLWEGKVGGDVGGGCRLRDPQAVLASLSLEGAAISTNGVIHGGAFLQEIDQYLGVRKDLKEIRFKDFSHHLAVKDGRYGIHDLTLHGFDTDWWGDGWIAFDGGIDLRLNVKLPAGFRPEVGNFAPVLEMMRGEDGRLALAMQLSGKASKPAVALDLSGAKAKTQQRVQEGVKSGVDRLLDKLKRK